MAKPHFKIKSITVLTIFHIKISNGEIGNFPTIFETKKKIHKNIPFFALPKIYYISAARNKTKTQIITLMAQLNSTMT